MVRVRTASAVVAGMAAMLFLSARPTTQQFGSITFPTSGAPAAQEAFLTGVKALHNFQFDEAAVAFKQAQTADPQFAMAYWGEAMTYNHSIWQEQDFEKGTATLQKVGKTSEERIAKAKTDLEKEFIFSSVYKAEGVMRECSVMPSSVRHLLSATYTCPAAND